MIIGSFDIGILNLGLCIIESKGDSFEILEWKNINLLDQISKKMLCHHQKCNKKIHYWIPEDKKGLCGVHHKSLLKKKMIDNRYQRYTTTKNTSDFELNQNIINTLEKYPQLWEKCDQIIFESQMKSNMKKVCFMIFSFLSQKSKLDTSSIKDMKLISAIHKLQLPKDLLDFELPEEETSTRLERKALATKHCNLIISNCGEPKWKMFYQQQKQKHDLADAFLQSIWFLYRNKELRMIKKRNKPKLMIRMKK